MIHYASIQILLVLVYKEYGNSFVLDCSQIVVVLSAYINNISCCRLTD